jgi:peptidyl-prolyl cis-trans isomerase C
MMQTRRLHERCSLTAVLVVGAGLAAFAQQPSADGLRVVAQVGGQPIVAADVEQRLAENRKQAATEGRLDAFGTKAPAVALDQLVDLQLFALAAREQGLDKRADVRRAIERVVDQVLAETLVGERAAKLPLGDDVLRRYYETHPSEFEQPGRVRARHIVVKSQAEAEAVLGRLRRSADFAQMARANNIDSTRETGGELGWVARGVMVASFEKVLFGLEVGEISGVVQTPFGFHVVRAEEIEPPTRRPFDSVRNEVRQKVLEADILAWKASLREKHPVKVNEQVLRQIR